MSILKSPNAPDQACLNISLIDYDIKPFGNEISVKCLRIFNE